MPFKLLLLVLLVLLSCSVFAQEEDEKVFTKIEIEATTDVQQWNQHIKRRSTLPDSIQQKIPGGSYKVEVQFVINKMGDLGSVAAKNNPGYSLDKIAENIVRSYKGRWRPANQCGRDVNAYRTQSIIFVINNQKTI